MGEQHVDELHYRDHPFYQKLFADDRVPVLPRLDARMCRDYLSQYLPSYMIPNHFTVLDCLPLTPNGKIERQPTELDWDDAKWMAAIAHILESLSGKTLGLSLEDFQALDANAQLTLLSARLESANLLPVDADINTVRGIAQVIKADELAYLRAISGLSQSNNSV